mgnify:CR=1 FL=1
MNFSSFCKSACLVASAFVFSTCARDRAPNFPVLPGESEPGTFVVHQENFTSYEESFSADYGTIVVPESEHNERLLQLRLIRVRAKQQNENPPIFYFGPGPGQSNLAFQPPPKLLEKHDFIMVGYRGVDNLGPIYCPEIDHAFLGQKDNLGQQTRDSLSAAAAKCVANLQTLGIALDDYSIAKVLEDVEKVREALGFQKIHILGEAFGGRIASLYSEKFPEVIERMVLLAPSIPQKTLLTGEEVDSQLVSLVENWQSSPASKNRRIDFGSVLQNAPEHWLIFRIDPGKVRTASYFMLRHRHSAAMVLDAFAAAGEGDASGLALLSQAYDMLIPSSANWADFLAKMETWEEFGLEQYAAQGTGVGAPLSELLSGASAFSPEGIDEQRAPTDTTNATETLIFTGDFDVTTSASEIERSYLASMPNAKQIILVDLGHTTDIWSVNPAGIQDAIVSFFGGATMESHFGFDTPPIEFEVGVSFPKAAKIAVALALLVLTLIVGGFIFIAKLFKHKPAYRQPTN